MHHPHQHPAACCPLAGDKPSPQPLRIPAGKFKRPVTALLPGLMASVFLALSGHNLVAATYYSDAATGDPTQTTSWTNSSGLNPADFAEGDTFIILNGANYTIPIAGTWTVNAANAGTAATVQINSGGTLTFELGSSQGGTLQIGGNFVQAVTGGVVGSSTTDAGLIEFTANSVNSTWTGSGNLSTPKMNVTVDAGATLDVSGLTSGLAFRTANTDGMTVNGTLITGTTTITGGTDAFFTLNGGGTLITATTSSSGLPGVFSGFAASKVTLPTAANYVFNGSAAQITGTSAGNVTMPTEVNNLTITNNAGVTLSQTIQVDNVLALAAGVATGNVILSTAGISVSGGSSTAYLNGQLTVTFSAPSAVSYTFPVGTASAYSPISLANFSDASGGILTASATASANPNLLTSGIDITANIARYWTLTADNEFTAPTYDFTGTYVAGDIQGGANPASLIISKWDGTSWAAPAASTSVGAPDYTVTGTSFNTDFGQFAAGNVASLPFVITTTSTAITNTSATLGATIYADNGSAINNYGIVWSTSANPTTANNVVQAGTTVTPPSVFTVNATGLPAATTIYYRGYAISSAGTGYSTNDTFLTLANDPITQASGVVSSSLQSGNLTFSWVRGNGSNCIVLVSAGTPVSSNPIAGTTYTASATFGSGSQTGSGDYVVYLGTGTNVTVSGLASGTTYYVAVYELNGSGGSENYLTPPATGNQTTVANPISLLTWTGAQDHFWNNTNNWDQLALPGVGTPVVIPSAPANQPIYSNQMAAASFGTLTSAGVLNINTNGFNSGAVLLNRPGGQAQMLVNNNGVVNVGGNVALTSNSMVTVASGGSLTASGALIIGSNPTGGTSSATVSSYGIVTNSGGTISVGSTSLNPGNASVTSGCLFVINGGTNNLGSVIITRSSAGSGGYSTLGTEGLMIYNGLVTMSGLNVGNGSGNSFLSALIAGGTVTNNGSVLVNQGTSARGSRLLQTGGLFVVTNLVNPDPKTSGSLNVYSVTGGTNIVGGISFGYASGSAGTVDFTNGAVMYVGSQGMAWDGVVTLSDVLGNGSLLGATADWTGSAPMQLALGTATLQAAGLDGTAHNITLSGVVSGSGALLKTGGGTLTLNAADTFSGNTISSSGTLALGAAGSLASPAIIIGSGATFDVSALGGLYGPASGQTLSGFGTVNGLVTATKGSIQPGSNSVTGTLTFGSGLTENGGAANNFVLSANPLGANDLIAVTGNLTATGANTIQVSGGVSAGSDYNLIQYSGSFSGSVANFNLVGVDGYLTNIDNAIVLHALVSLRGPTNIVWVGNATANNWDMVSTNWLNAGVLDNFITGDNALFSNQGGSNLLVNIAANVSPSSVVVNTSSNYVFAGTGSIIGSGGLTVSNGSLTILTANTYTGPTVLAGGDLLITNIANSVSASPIGAASADPGNLVFNGGALGYLGAPAATDHGITLTNAGGTIDVTNGSTLTLNGTLTGPGNLTLIDTGSLTLTAANSYTGNTTISNGTLTLNNATAAGSGNLVLAGGTLSLTTGSQPTYANNLTVTADSTLNSAGGNNNISGGAWTGGPEVTLNLLLSSGGTFTVNGTMTNFYGTIELGDNTGFFRFNAGGGNTQFGATNATIDLGTNTATLQARNPGTIAIGALAGGPSTKVEGPSSTAGTLVWTVGSNPNVPDSVYYGTIADSAGNENSSLTKIGAGTLTLAGQSTYTGATIISSGTLALINNPFTLNDGSFYNSPSISLASGAVLDVSGRSDGTFVLGTFLGTIQTLTGGGTVLGNLNVTDGNTVAPGDGFSGNTGTLTVTNNITLAGTTWMKLNRAASPNSDQLVSSLSTITYGGALVVTNVGASLQAGDTFTLFSGGGLSGGAFSTIQLPNYYNWDTSQLAVNGTITVSSVALPAISSADYSSIQSGTIVLNAINGLPYDTVNILTSTNLALPLASWTTNSTTSFDGNGDLTGYGITVDPTQPRLFIRLQAQ